MASDDGGKPAVGEIAMVARRTRARKRPLPEKTRAAVKTSVIEAYIFSAT
jgi:hypothetical protein